jgi:hypothetical protein
MAEHPGAEVLHVVRIDGQLSSGLVILLEQLEFLLGSNRRGTRRHIPNRVDVGDLQGFAEAQ